MDQKQNDRDMRIPTSYMREHKSTPPATKDEGMTDVYYGNGDKPIGRLSASAVKLMLETDKPLHLPVCSIVDVDGVSVVTPLEMSDADKKRLDDMRRMNNPAVFKQQQHFERWHCPTCRAVNKGNYNMCISCGGPQISQQDLWALWRRGELNYHTYTKRLKELGYTHVDYSQKVAPSVDDCCVETKPTDCSGNK